LSIALLEVDPVLLAFLFKPLFGLLNPLRSSALESNNWDNDFVDEEDDAFSSSDVLPLPLSDVSGTFAPHLKQNLPPEFTLQPHETQNAAILGNTDTGNGGKTSNAG